MKKHISLLLGMCLIVETVFPSFAFSEKGNTIVDVAKDTIVQEADKEPKVEQKKFDIKKITLYIMGVAGCATAMVTYAYNKFLRSVPCEQAESITNLPQEEPRKISEIKEDIRPQANEIPQKPSLIQEELEKVPEAKEDVRLQADEARKKTDVPQEAKLDESLKAIHWQDNLCWFNTTILMFYYHKDFHDCIASFPIDEATELLHRDTEPKNKSKLEAFTELAVTFRNIDKCNRIYRFPNRELYNKLDTVIDFRNNETARKVKYGQFGAPFQGELYNMIAEIFIFIDNFLTVNKGKFPKMNAWLSQISDDIASHKNKPKHWSLNSLFKKAGVAQAYGVDRHYWINITRDREIYEIGRSLQDVNAIALIKA